MTPFLLLPLQLLRSLLHRFERGVDIEQVEWASARACQLICELAGGTVAPGMIDVRAPSGDAPRVSCRYAMIDRLLGVSVPPDRVKAIMARLDLQVVEETPAGLTVAVPSAAFQHVTGDVNVVSSMSVTKSIPMSNVSE